MNRSFLMLAILLWNLPAAGAQTYIQQFTGIITSVEAGPGIFSAPVGSQASGTFTVNLDNFVGAPYPQMNGNAWYQFINNPPYENLLSNTDTLAISTINGSSVVSNIQGVTFTTTSQVLVYGGNYAAATLTGAMEVALCQGPLNISLGALPITTAPAGCVGIVSLSYNTGTGTTYAILVELTSLSAMSISQDKVNGDPSNQPGNCGCGDPISLSTGNVFEAVSDYSTTGPNVLSFARNYNSQGDPSSLAKRLGSHWRSNFDRYLRIASSTSLTAERADGQELAFTLQNGAWTSDSDVDITLTNSGTSWILTDHSDITEMYTTLSSSEAQLTSSRSRNGYTQNLSYSGNELTTVTDSYGRTLQFGYFNGLLQTVTTPDNTVLTYGYTSSGLNTGVLDRLTTVTYSTVPQTSQTYVYENAALPFGLTGMTDEDGNRYATWTYDTLGRAVSNYMGAGANQTTIAYDDTTGNRTVTNALGQSLLYKFTKLQGIPKLTEIDRQATSTTAAATRDFIYDSNGYLASQTDWDGNLTTFVNDVHGQPTTIVEASGTPQARTTTTTYLSNFHLPKEIVRPGITTDYAYDPSGNLLTRTAKDTTTTSAPYSTNGQTRVSTFTYGNFGLPATSKTARSDVNGTTNYTYLQGALTTLVNALGQSIQITNTPGGRPQTVVDANGVTTKLTYDPRQRLTSRAVQTSAGTLTTSFGYDPAGNLLTTTLPDGSSLTNTYDTAHRLAKVVDSLGNYTTYSLDGLGDRTQTSVYQSNGTLTWQGSGSFDALGRELVHTAGAGQTTTRTFDSNGKLLTAEDALNHMTTNSYDALNRVSSSTDANGGVTTPAYDTNDRVVSVTDANGNATAYVRDGFGEVIQQASPDSGVAIFSYDADANLTSKTDALGIVTNQSFDAIDRRLTTTYPAHTAENVAYTYDQIGTGFSFGVGRMTSVTDAAGSLRRMYDERGNLTSEVRGIGSTTLATGYTYDGASRIASMAYPDGTLVGYQHDAAGYVSTVTAKLPGASSTTTLANLNHQPFGPIKTVSYGNGVAETWTFDQAYRPTSIVDSLSGINLQSLAYGYDATDNVKTIADAVNPANTQAFGYDPVNRLTSAVSSTGGYGNFAWTYDNVGNRLSQQQGTTLTTYGYTPGTNRLLTISSGIEKAFTQPLLIAKPESKAGRTFWANAPPAETDSRRASPMTASVPPSSRRSDSFGWAILFTGFAGVFSLRRKLRVHRLLGALCFAAILSGSTTLFSGCVIGTSKTASSMPIGQVSIIGNVHGGQQPIAGSSIQLYAVGTTGDGSAATPLLKMSVLTSAAGGFSIPTFSCPTASSLVYLVATGGNPGLAAGTNNSSIALMAALGTCGSLSSLPYVTVNEVTTVGSLAALYPYLSSPATLGSGSSDAVELSEAFARVNEYINIARGTVPGPTLPAGYYAASLEIQTLGDAIAACINSTGALTTGSPCEMLYSLTPSGSTAPSNTIGALLNILNNPTQNVAGILALVSAVAPFQPTLTSSPASWSLPIVTGPLAPLFSLPTGSYGVARTVTLTSPTTGTTIYYTTDGSMPTAASTKYTGAITVSSTEIVNAIAAYNVFAISTVASASYIINSSVAAVTVTTNANGNITSIPPANSIAYATFSYNNANRLASVTGSPMAAMFVYDWQGQRFSKTDGGTPATLYSYSQDGAVIVENDGGAITDYIYADGRPVADIQPSATPTANQVSYVMTDRLGTPQRLTNSGGNMVWSTSYQPFGPTGAISATVNQNLRLPGQLDDTETGFSYNLNRDYMPILGRYLETDPLGLQAGSDTFTYGGNNPTVNSDPLGLIDYVISGGFHLPVSPGVSVGATTTTTVYSSTDPSKNNTDGPITPDVEFGGIADIGINLGVKDLTGTRGQCAAGYTVNFGIGKYLGFSIEGIRGGGLFDPRIDGFSINLGFGIPLGPNPITISGELPVDVPVAQGQPIVRALGPPPLR